jgi:hypothetical protein
VTQKPNRTQFYILQSWDSSVSMVIRLQARWQGNGSFIPFGPETFLCAHTSCRGHWASYLVGMRCSFYEGKMGRKWSWPLTFV